MMHLVYELFRKSKDRKLKYFKKRYESNYRVQEMAFLNYLEE